MLSVTYSVAVILMPSWSTSTCSLMLSSAPAPLVPLLSAPPPASVALPGAAMLFLGPVSELHPNNVKVIAVILSTRASKLVLFFMV